MLTPERLLRLMIEFIFVLLGGLLIWLGLAGPAHGRTVDRHGAPWLVLSVALIVWGLRGLLQPGPVVAALAKLDPRVVARASGRSHARDFARAVPSGLVRCSQAGGGFPGAAWHDRLVFDFPATLRELRHKEWGGRLHAALYLSFSSSFEYNPRENRPPSLCSGICPGHQNLIEKNKGERPC